MNTEDPQGLPTNQLGQTITAIGHRLEEHATKIVMGICVILVVAAGCLWWSRQSSAKATAAWTLLEQASSVEQYAHIADTHKGTIAGRWAKLREAESYQQAGMSRLFTDREFALGELKKASERYSQVADEKGAEPAILERALWGLAVTTEATNSGDTGKAIDAYQRLLDALPETFYKQVAEQRIASLKTGGAKEFYAWFSKQTPKPSETRPKDGEAKDDLESMLPSPGKSEFNHDSILKPQGDAKKPDAEKKSDEKPADPAKSEPAKEEPKTEKPADPAKPEGDAAKSEPKPEAKPEAPAKEEAKPEDKPSEKPAEPKAEKKE